MCFMGRASLSSFSGIRGIETIGGDASGHRVKLRSLNQIATAEFEVRPFHYRCR
jgi:hypothetical protein